MKHVSPRRLDWARSPLVAVILALALVLAACGDDDSSSTTAASTTSDGGGGEVKNPTELRMHTMTEPSTWDPVGTCSWCGFSYGVYEYLVDYPPLSTELAPVLATEVPSDLNGLISGDGLVYTFPIREGVTFHDGTALTAEDVKYSFDHAMALNLPDGTGSRLVDIIDQTRVVDDFTFEVTLKAPAAYFLNSVVASFAAAIVSKDAVEANGGVVANEPNEWMLTHEVGTGPYTLAQWDRNEQLYFEPFQDYWGEVPALPPRWLVVTDDAAATVALRAGDLDWIEPIPQLLEEVEGDTGVCPYEEGALIEPILAAYNLNIDPDLLPDEDTIPADFFHDPRVRQAFNYTFDYDTFITEVMRGMGSRPVGFRSPSLDTTPTSRSTQDLAKAEQLFREAGWWDDGFTLSVLVESEDAQFYALGLLLKDNLAALNPKFVLNVIGVSGAVFDEAFAERPYPYAMWIKNQDPFHDPHFIFMDHWNPDGFWGTAFTYRNGYADQADADEMAALIAQAGAETNLEARYALYTELQQRAFDNPMWLWAAQEKNVQLPRCWLTDFSKNPLWPMPRAEYFSK